MSLIAKTPKPPYYAVIFSNHLSDSSADIKGYEEMADRMVELASKEEGFLGYESVRDGLGITISYWVDLDAIKSWKANVEHLEAQKLGRDKWYSTFKTRISKVERDYGM